MREVWGSAPVESVDSYVDMTLRREINSLAVEPVDMYVKGLELASRAMPLDAQSMIVDVGCSSGRFIIEAAQATGTPSSLIGVDVQDEPYRRYLPASLGKTNFTFLQARGENMPLADSSVDLVMGHNVLFRADKYRLLKEMKRVARPDGLIVFSTNAKKHAALRHHLENEIAAWVSGQIEAPIRRLDAPAHGIYVEDVPDFVETSGELEPVDDFIQNCPALITRDGLAIYAYSLKLSANRLSAESDTAKARRLWRERVDDFIVPYIKTRMRPPGQANDRYPHISEPYFTDRVHRGLFVFRNKKR